jgi:hypothetical protein
MKIAFLIILCCNAFLLSLGQMKSKTDTIYLRLSTEAYSLYTNKSYKASAAMYEKLFAYAGTKMKPDDWYNAACSWALCGDIEKAFQYLEKSINVGMWSQVEHLRNDVDLLSLHSDSRWQLLLEQAIQNEQTKEAKLNKPLAGILKRVYASDQECRAEIDSIKEKYGWSSPEMKMQFQKVKQIDSANLVVVKEILDSHGWPGQEEVGTEGALAVFLVIQHSDLNTQIQYLPLMRKAVKDNLASPGNLATLEDRILVKQGKPQKYGTQLTVDSAGNTIFYPIEHEIDVNKRREQLGLEPIEFYAKRFGIEYIPINKRRIRQK